MDVMASHTADVAGTTVRRALPQRGRRTVGSWCFLDHFGPASGPTARMSVGPHPHIGLQTVTWLVAGEVLHCDSLGSEQLIRPGQLNLMTAGHGVSHSEESPAAAPPELHGVKLWVALPEATRDGAPAFEHHEDLPATQPGPGVTATVFVGSFGGATSPARADTPQVGVELELGRGADVSLGIAPTFEHGIVVLDGRVSVDDRVLAPGALGYLGLGREEVHLGSSEGARLLLVGGEPFPDELHMWWNFVGRDHAEIERAADEWNRHDERFGDVDSGLERIAAPRPPWRR